MSEFKVKMSNLKIGDSVNILFDFDTEKEKVWTGIVIRYGGYAGLTDPRIYIKFDDDEHRYYRKERLEFLMNECHKYECQKLENSIN